MTSMDFAGTPIAADNTNWPRRLALIALLTALADWLLFGHPLGISVAAMIVALAAGVALANPDRSNNRLALIHGGILLAAIAPMLEQLTLLSILVGGAALAAFALAVTAPRPTSLLNRLTAIGWLLIDGPLQILRDLPHLQTWMQFTGLRIRFSVLHGWIVPLLFGAIFLALFAIANPLIANWFAQWSDWRSPIHIDLTRLLFWGIAAVGVWTFVGVRGERYAAPTQPAPTTAAPVQTSGIFNDAAVRRSLILFNLLFAVQTALDIQYLWRGAALPDGMSYAAYAHRGAYPLIVTALLAAGFVIAAMRPGSAAERSDAMRALVFIWVGQNLLLMVSSILRLDLYVAVYSLTYWRIAAFIWMLLVAAGLVLIAARIVLTRSNAWLISANLATLALTLYVCCWIDFPRLVAEYNVDHSVTIAAEGRRIDLNYLADLGIGAVPALDRYIAANPNAVPECLAGRRNWLVVSHRRDMTDWRAWSFRGARLNRYLEKHDGAAALRAH